MVDKKAVSVLSGGIDSSTVTAIAKNRGYEVIALSFDYGQKHIIELEYAKKVCRFLKIKEHYIFKLDIGKFGGSALTDKNISISVSDSQPSTLKSRHVEIPITYVPMRNLVFLSIATSLAEARNIRVIFFGANIIDYSGYPDCRPEFIENFEKTANSGSKIFHALNKPFKIVTPLINMTKVQIIKKGLSLGLDYSLTYSCYNGGKKHCGKCDSCHFRFTAFKRLKIPFSTEH